MLDKLLSSVTGFVNFDLFREGFMTIHSLRKLQTWDDDISKFFKLELAHIIFLILIGVHLVIVKSFYDGVAKKVNLCISLLMAVVFVAIGTAKDVMDPRVFPNVTVATWLTLIPSSDVLAKFEGENFIVGCYADNVTSIKFFKDGEQSAILDSGLINIKETKSSTDLQIFNLQKHHEGKYFCEATRGDEIFKRGFTLRVMSPISFVGVKRTQYGRVGRVGRIQCAADGEPSLSISWLAPDRDLSRHIPSGNSLTIMNVTQEDGGAYVCRVSILNEFISDIQDVNITYEITA